MQRLEFHAMGCQMLAVLDSDAPAAARRLARVPGWFAGWERQLSRFREDSELNRLNRAAGRPVPIGAVLWDVLQAAVEAAQRSGGLVVPTLLDALDAAGYDRSFDRLPPDGDTGTRIGNHDPASRSTSGDRQSPVAGAAPVDWRAIELDERARSVRLPPGVRLDLGGIAKGWAADRAARRLGTHGPVLVDAGGDIAVSGPRADGSAWPIGVADPAAPDRQVELLLLGAGGVATSGRDYRRWRQGKVWQHHILDPRTGRPAETDVLSATVIAPTTRVAEAAAKAALILGGRAGVAWLEAQPLLAGLLVLENRRVLRTRRLQNYLWS